MNQLRIAITLNGVVRDLHSGFCKLYDTIITNQSGQTETHSYDMTDIEANEQNTYIPYDIEDLPDIDINNINDGTIITTKIPTKSDDKEISLDFNDIPKIKQNNQREFTNIHADDDVVNSFGNHKFIDYQEYYDFVFEDNSFELFGRSPLTYDKAMQDLNILYSRFIREGHQVFILSNERANSKSGTLLFLSQHKCMANNYKFVENYSKIWDTFDIIITADPSIYARKPFEKHCLKIITKYNFFDNYTPSYNSISELIK